MTPDTFVAADLDVPRTMATPEFTIRPIGINDAVKDYDAVMTSRDRLLGVFGPDSTWPSENLSLEQNIVDLGWHQKEFQRRTSFAFAVMSPDEERELGCVYLYPPSREGFDVEVYVWVRADRVDLDEPLCTAVRDWIANDWPFERPAFPGRSTSWGEWATLQNAKTDS
jgi:hypothetical protein